MLNRLYKLINVGNYIDAVMHIGVGKAVRQRGLKVVRCGGRVRDGDAARKWRRQITQMTSCVKSGFHSTHATVATYATQLQSCSSEKK